MPRLISVSKTRPQVKAKIKTVTRRDGWWDKERDRPLVKPGDLLELVEWSTFVGPRWVCENCWEIGPCKPGVGEWHFEHPCSRSFRYGPPRRLGLVRVVSIRREPLGAITAEDVEREGFPGKSPEWFVDLYCSPGKPEPGRLVTRIEFEYLEAGA